MYRRLFVTLLFISLFATSPFFARSVFAVEETPIKPVLVRVLELINYERAMASLPPVTINITLMNEAARFSGVQAAIGTLSHAGNDGTTAGQRLTNAGYIWSSYGENLAAGQETPEELVAAWMASPGHRANILRATVTEIGLGHTFRTDDPSYYFDYWVMEVAKSR